MRRGLCARAAGLVAALALLPALAADPPSPAADLVPRPDPALPIDLDADYSEFDRRNNRLVFRGLRVRQGALAISADAATADPADFVASRWVFTGNVLIRNAGTEVRCATADLAFRDNVLRTAVLRGSPAEFTQPRAGARLPTEGRADQLDYDPVAGLIRLRGNARLADGTNEITGDRIDYDLRREVVSAGAGSGGPVRMRIVPQPGKTPPPEPAP
jgi:lipopolysaccharide export system protein LptA